MKPHFPSIQALALAAGCATASAQISPPPQTGRNGEHIIYLSNASMNYAVSDFGWSDAWMMPPQPVLTLQMDVLCGDDAPNLHYKINGVQMAGNGWITPTLDAGALTASYDTHSP